jgi:hypothetical protein
MIEQFSSYSNHLEFKCSECNTVFNHAIRIFNGDPRRSKTMKSDPNHWDLVCIELRCPCCAMKKVFKLSINKK